MSLIEQALRQAQADAAARHGGAMIKAVPPRSHKATATSEHPPMKPRLLIVVATVAVCVLAGLVIMAHQQGAVPGYAPASSSLQVEQSTEVSDEREAPEGSPEQATEQPAPVAAPATEDVAASAPALPLASEGGNFVPQPQPAEEVATASPAEASASPDQTAETRADQPMSAPADQPKPPPATAPAPEKDFTPSAHRISAIMAGSTGGTAIIDGLRIRVGDSVGPATVTAIMPDHVELQCRGQHYVMGM